MLRAIDQRFESFPLVRNGRIFRLRRQNLVRPSLLGPPCSARDNGLSPLPDEYFALDAELAANDITVYNNSDTDTKLINVVCADGSTDIDTVTEYEVSDKDLYAAHSIISELRWNDGREVGVRIAIGDFVSADGIAQVTLDVQYIE